MSRIEPGYDVVIVGARAAGAATAYLLARHGLRVLLVDRSRYGTDTLSTHALMRGGVLQLTRWGLLDEIIAAGTPAVRRTTFRYADDLVPITLKASYGVEALYAPRRTVLDPILVDAAAAAGADVRFGIAVTGVERDRHGTVTGIIGRTRDGEPLRVAARIVVGADGIRSTIADPVDAPFERVGTVGRRPHLRLLDRAGDRRLRMELPARCRLWRRPDQRRPGVCVRQRLTPPHRPRRPGTPHPHRRRVVGRPRRPARRRRAHRPRCGPSPAGPATYDDHGVTAGLWSATPATSRTRWARTG